MVAPFRTRLTEGRGRTSRNLAFNATATTGTIAAGSNQLTVASPSGFTAGDTIIIEVGGESGAGLRGTKGVGGTWPALSYANTTAMNADSGQVDLTYAWVVPSADVYRYISGVWTQIPVSQYYIAKVVPKSLVTTIVSIAGSVLTLNATAFVAATNANVYFDNFLVFYYSRTAGESNVTLNLAAGTFAISDRLKLVINDHFILQGAGSELTTIFVPNGIFSTDPNGQSGGILAAGCEGVVFQDFHYKSNARLNGFGMWVTETSVPQGTACPSGVTFSLCNGGTARNLKITDVFQGAVAPSRSYNVWAYNCRSIHTAPLKEYIQWDFQWADCHLGGCVDCSVESDWLVPGFEGFKSVGVQFIRPVGRNATFSFNSDGGFLVEDAVLLFTANSQDSSGAFSAMNPIFNITTNAAGGSPELGGTITNVLMVQAGYINANNDTLSGISINEDNPNITVTGGSYTAPDYAAPSTVWGPWGYSARLAANPVLTNFTVVGTPKPGYQNILINSAGTITNCTAQVIVFYP